MSSTTFELESSVAVLTLDEPDRRNVLTEEMVGEIVAAVARAEADESVSALVVTGNGRAFCAGADLGTLADGGPHDYRRIYDGFLSVAHCSLPTIAAVNGPAVGAGMNLALACDVRIAGADARFVTRFPTLGLHPGGGHTWMLARAVGPQVAAAMLLFGVELDAAGAVAHGLALQTCPADELRAAAVDLAQRAAAVPRPLAFRLKETLAAAPRLETQADALAYEFEAQMWSREQPFFRERVEARRPR